MNLLEINSDLKNMFCGWEKPKGKPIPILIPNKDGYELTMNVLRGISSQSIPVSLIQITRPQVDDQRYPDKKGYVSQSECRNLLRDEIFNNVKWAMTDFILMMNRDVILNPNATADLIAFLKLHDDYGAITLHSRLSGSRDRSFCNQFFGSIRQSKHLDISCIMFRRSALKIVEFNNSRGCNCCDVWDCLVENRNMKMECFSEYGQYEDIIL